MSRTLYPLSVDLNGKAVLVVGAGTIAARKLTELIRCSADITVIAQSPTPAIDRLGSVIRLLRRNFEKGDELGRYLVFACTNEPEVNQQIATLCHKANILCNVVDASEKGSFHVPGVIRQGEVTVTVSTGGSVPGLTRYLKTVLSDTLGEQTAQLASILGRFRHDLRNGPLADRAQSILETLPYRKLLEDLKQGHANFVDAYLAQLYSTHNHADSVFKKGVTGNLMSALSKSVIGRSETVTVQTVTLVGAGPGHPGLLTLLAAEALRKAEVIIHDRLIPTETLGLASKDCLLIAAGKRGHFESVRQEEIQSKLVEMALQGKRVVRLKGGDPFVFGRGWEEVLALEAHGIPWTVIPGVSSTTAAPTWAGIPLTHRGLARSYAVMSGMAYSETNTEVPHADTIVLVMGLHRLAEIVLAFVAQGWAPTTPVAAIQSGTQLDQRVCYSTLAEINQESVKQGFDSPTLLIIGKVVGLAQRRIGIGPNLKSVGGN